MILRVRILFPVFNLPYVILACANGIGDDEMFEECDDALEEV